MKAKHEWDHWQQEAEAWLSGKKDSPPESPATGRILLLLQALQEVDRVLSDPRTTTSMPQTHRLVKKALRG